RCARSSAQRQRHRPRRPHGPARDRHGISEPRREAEGTKTRGAEMRADRLDGVRILARRAPELQRARAERPEPDDRSSMTGARWAELSPQDTLGRVRWNARPAGD